MGKKPVAKKAAAAEEKEEAAADAPAGWTCKECQYENEAADTECASCGEKIPTLTHPNEVGILDGFGGS